MRKYEEENKEEKQRKKQKEREHRNLKPQAYNHNKKTLDGYISIIKLSISNYGELIDGYLQQTKSQNNNT